MWESIGFQTKTFFNLKNFKRNLYLKSHCQVGDLVLIMGNVWGKALPKVIMALHHCFQIYLTGREMSIPCQSFHGMADFIRWENCKVWCLGNQIYLGTDYLQSYFSSITYFTLDITTKIILGRYRKIKQNPNPTKNWWDFFVL